MIRQLLKITNLDTLTFTIIELSDLLPQEAQIKALLLQLPVQVKDVYSFRRGCLGFRVGLVAPVVGVLRGVGKEHRRRAEAVDGERADVAGDALLVQRQIEDATEVGAKELQRLPRAVDGVQRREELPVGGTVDAVALVAVPEGQPRGAVQRDDRVDVADIDHAGVHLPEAIVAVVLPGEVGEGAVGVLPRVDDVPDAGDEVELALEEQLIGAGGDEEALRGEQLFHRLPHEEVQRGEVDGVVGDRQWDVQCG